MFRVFMWGRFEHCSRRGIFEQFSNVPPNISMTLNFYFGRKLWNLLLLQDKEIVHTYLKQRNKPDVPEVVIQEAVRAVQERRLSLRVAAPRYGITHTALHYRI